ncbi:Cytochrome c553 [Pseudomonas linyingensis]|uniref:Cytochrome c553 n=1 Tax=Pseudomonas linyingensis TaxID=915471 RepID=A0A1H6SGR7_9PSED|nr:c-type cytochrome [Pseudomonas linyingensis]SEI67109.1 Cytochrome c553 [Pseudomonas linyingensis]
MTFSRLPLAGLCALLLAAQVQAADGQKLLTQGGANPAAMACAGCHGADGMGMAAAGFPRLAGLSAGYLAKQIGDFRSGTRANPIMQPIAAALSDDEINAVSRTLAALPAPAYPRTGRAEKAEGSGARLALRGAWERNIPECVSCHGPGGLGVGDTFPPLAGQSAQYLSAQLNAWRQGTRKNDPADLMGHVARALSDAEVTAVSDYFASLNPQGAAQ